MVSERWDQIRKAQLTLFKVGDEVEFHHKGKTRSGEVKTINEKSVSVNTPDGTRWRVPPGKLKRVS